MKDSGDIQVKAAAARYAGLRNRGNSELAARSIIEIDPNYSHLEEHEIEQACGDGERDHQLTLKVRGEAKKFIIEDQP